MTTNNNSFPAILSGYLVCKHSAMFQNPWLRHHSIKATKIPQQAYFLPYEARKYTYDARRSSRRQNNGLFQCPDHVKKLQRCYNKYTYYCAQSIS